MIAAVVLAAGQSRRMAGGHKLLARFETGTVIGATVAAAAAGGVDRVVVVVGHAAAAVEAAVRAAAIEAAVGAAWPGMETRFAVGHAEGMAASLRAGLAALGPETAAMLVCLGDMPLVRPATIASLCAAFRAGAGTIVAPVAAGRRGHPVLFGAAHFAALAALRGDEGARALLAAVPPATVEVDDPGIHVDVDTEDALADARRLLEAAGGEGCTGRPRTPFARA